jgi:hypothetical protein
MPCITASKGGSLDVSQLVGQSTNWLEASPDRMLNSTILHSGTHTELVANFADKWQALLHSFNRTVGP